jgi:DNA-binding IclR family transcriptional regulator
MNDADTTDAIKGWLSLISMVAALLLDLLKRSGGASLKELQKATGWQGHSVRGFLSTLGKKMGLAVTSTKAADEERRYSVKA